MDKELVQKTLDYIEDNLKAEISAGELSNMTGYSLFHFYRIFQKAVGMPVMQYITRRKLLHAIYDISLGDKKADAVMAYGYETYAGEKHILKYTANLGTVKKAVELSEALTNVGLVTSKVVKTIAGADYIEEEGLYYYVTDKIQGERIKASKLYLDDYVKNARFIGEIIGQLSLALKNVETIVDDNNLLATVKDWAVLTLVDKLNVSREFKERFITKLSDMYPFLPKQIIHRDPNPGNVIVADDKWGFIDFDLRERNVRIYDPCYAATAILSESFEAGNEEKLIKWIGIYREIMIGFDSVVNLSEIEKDAIPYIVLANQFIATAYFSGNEKYSDIYVINVKMTEWMIDNFEKLAIIF